MDSLKIGRRTNPFKKVSRLKMKSKYLVKLSEAISDYSVTFTIGDL
jgi:hypothetical protein